MTYDTWHMTLHASRHFSFSAPHTDNTVCIIIIWKSSTSLVSQILLHHIAELQIINTVLIPLYIKVNTEYCCNTIFNLNMFTTNSILIVQMHTNGTSM